MSGPSSSIGQRSMRPAATLFVARAVYAFNWYNVGAVLPLIGVSLVAGTAALGIVLGAFLVGVGIFQIPAGFAALRWGARRVSLFGLGFMGVMCLLSAFSPTLEWLAATRFLAGVGAAFFFSPGLSLIASYYPAGQRGPIIGLYNGGFSAGGAIGLFGGAFVGEVVGWQWALAIGGIAQLGMTAVAAALLPRDLAPGTTSPGRLRALWTSGLPVLRSRSIWALSLALTGFWGAVYIVAQYFVDYANADHANWGSVLAGGLAALVVVVSFPGGPVGGWIAERGWDRRLVIGLAAIVASGVVLAIPFASLLAMWPLMIALGFVDGVIFAVLYLIPSYLPESGGSGLALGVALVNSIQVLLGSGIAIAFGFVAEGFGYEWAWIFAASISFALLPLLFFVRPNRGVRAAALLSDADASVHAQAAP